VRLAGKILTLPPYRGIIITREKGSELKFGVPKVPKIWISVNQEIRVQDIREPGYQEKNKINLISW
jgi:hypothetical protein